MLHSPARAGGAGRARSSKDPVIVRKASATRVTAAVRKRRLKPRVVKGLQITAVDRGYIVYDVRRERVHYLNHTAGLVLDLCTGSNAWADIVSLVGQAFDLPRKPEREVGRILQQFADEGLVSLPS